MGLIVDIVPNHMAVGSTIPGGRTCCAGAATAATPGSTSTGQPDAALAGKVLLPFLGQPYAEALEAGELVLRLDTEQGELYGAP
jgi:(1->4)-alpha-D-glucan 1-alpha-D-glucosylmutase